MLSRTIAEQTTLRCWHREDHSDLYHTVLYQRAERKVSSRLGKDMKPYKTLQKGYL